MSESAAKAEARNLQFIESHRPGLVAGEYNITLEHWVTTPKSETAIKAGAAEYRFSIAAPRFSLNPQDVSAVFPPPGSLGDHSNVLPHIQFDRSTLPWERRPRGSDETAPWLSLLVLHEDELGAGSSRKINTQTVKLEKLTIASEGHDGIWWPGVTAETHLGQHPEDQLNIIDVDVDLLKKIFPEAIQRKWLTHVRLTTDHQGQPAAEAEVRAVIIANRLPSGRASTLVHLVSLEGRDIDDEIARATRSTGTRKIRFVTLHDWRFDCVSHTQSFKGLVSSLNRTVLMQISAAADVLPQRDTPLPQILARAFESIGRPLQPGASLSWKGDVHWVLRNGIQGFYIRREGSQLTVIEPMPGVLRLPPVENADAEAYLRRGAVALRHATRSGNRTVSWYHGPFVPGNLLSPAIEFPIPAADKALHYNPSIGMLDVSYAAAWELGRLLTLQNKAVAAALYDWKRQHAQAEKLLAAEAEWLHLPFKKKSPPGNLPRNVAGWFRDLSVLRGVPFRYVVPDEKMLPAESLRFFQIDSLWIQCLLDGAFSIGRVLTGDHTRDSAHAGRLAADLKPDGGASGLLLRSAVVSGWPDLLVDGYDQSGPLEKLREDQLSPNILLCLFEDVVERIDIHQRPEALHFGLSATDASENRFTRVLRDKEGKSLEGGVAVPVSDEGVVGWQQLVQNITRSSVVQHACWQDPVTSSLLAFQLIEGVELVRFTVE